MDFPAAQMKLNLRGKIAAENRKSFREIAQQAVTNKQRASAELGKTSKKKGNNINKMKERNWRS